MKCINCYRDIDDGLKFCPKCGFMQPSDRAAYETEHPELANALPKDENSQAAAEMNLWQQNTGNNSTAPHAPEPQIAVNGEVIPPLPPALPSEPPALPSEPPTIARPPLSRDKSVTLGQSRLEKTPLSSPIPVAPSQDKTVECPICHQTIPFGTHQCPYCKQLLDWSHVTPHGEEKDDSDDNSKRGILWILLSIVIALILGCAGYFIYTAVKDNSRSSRNNEESYLMGPTGYPKADARRALNELIELIEDAEISDQDDLDRLEYDMKEIQNKYEDYYRERNRLDEFNYEIENLENDPEMKRRVERASERLLNLAQDIE